MAENMTEAADGNTPVEAAPENDGAEEPHIETEIPEEKLKCPECKPGAPLWMATFADMATLLMAFFVLILSFSDVKVDKYKAVVGSLMNAFGMPKVQLVPKATSIMESNFSPSIATPTPVNQPNQKVHTPEKEVLERKQDPDSEDAEIRRNKRNLEQMLQTEIQNAQVEIKIDGDKIVVELKGDAPSGRDKVESDATKAAGRVSPERLGIFAKVSSAQQDINAKVEVREELRGANRAESDLTTRDPLVEKRLIEEATREVATFKERLESQIQAGLIEVEQRDRQIALLIAEKGTFDAGGADIDPSAVAALRDVRDVIMERTGKVTVVGHTDNMPIMYSNKFASNWELSSARAAAVADALSSLLGVPRSRIEIQARADTQPITDNGTLEGRRKNRRIEILLGPDLVQQSASM
jgi:chemotaxis protein MotB